MRASFVSEIMDFFSKLIKLTSRVEILKNQFRLDGQQRFGLTKYNIIDTFVVQENSGLPATNSETTHPEFFGEVDNYNLYWYGIYLSKNLKKIHVMNSQVHLIIEVLNLAHGFVFQQFHSIGKSPL